MDADEAGRRRFACEQRETFERITAAWDAAGRTRCAELLIRYGPDAGAWSTRHHCHGRDSANIRPED
ncbi:hypothetical protein AB5J52_39440 [Streptomyces sp. R39]|uniref:Transposase n=1 Tax=Streptomyces sp. R39 TaxID=3238631 RepID=A0AB39QZ12_9ACTN